MTGGIDLKQLARSCLVTSARGFPKGALKTVKGLGEMLECLGG